MLTACVIPPRESNTRTEQTTQFTTQPEILSLKAMVFPSSARSSVTHQDELQSWVEHIIRNRSQLGDMAALIYHREENLSLCFVALVLHLRPPTGE